MGVCWICKEFLSIFSSKLQKTLYMKVGLSVSNDSIFFIEINILDIEERGD